MVVGGGFAGLSVAARLAKLRHDVTVIEAADRLGGRLNRVDLDAGAFALAPETVTLPGVLRDLFRKSGRPLERAADLVPAGPRRHVFDRHDSLDLPFGNRADQHDAVLALFEDDHWSPWVDTWPDAWDVLRRTWLDRLPEGRADLDREARATVLARAAIVKATKKAFKKDRDLPKLVLDPYKLEGQDERLIPAFAAVRHYVERNFGRWGFDGGLPTLTAALETRLRERKVTVELGSTGVELATSGDLARGGSVTGVVTDTGSHDADIVVWCAGRWPAPLPQPPLHPAIPSSRTFVRVDPSVFADLPDEVLVHHSPPIRLWHNGDGRWTVIHQAGDDPMLSLAHAGLPFRDHLTAEPQTLSPSDLVRLGHWGWQWMRWTAVEGFPGTAPRDDLYLAGAHAWPSGLLGGGTVEEIGFATAAIAERIGPAPRT